MMIFQSGGRLFYLFLTGIESSWVAVILVMFMWSNSAEGDDVSSTILLSIWALSAYTFFSLPILSSLKKAYFDYSIF